MFAHTLDVERFHSDQVQQLEGEEIIAGFDLIHV